MIPERKTTLKGLAIIGMAVLFSVMIVAPQASGDILSQGQIKMSITVTPPPIIIKPPDNLSYKGATFEWNYTQINNTITGTLRVHVNFDVANTTNFLNILELINQGNITGNLTLHIIKWAKIGSYYLWEPYTNSIQVYINHNWQTPTHKGTQLLNNTTTGPFPLYPSNVVSYYIGVTYTQPPPLPPDIEADLNALGEYIDFTFTIVT